VNNRGINFHTEFVEINPACSRNIFVLNFSVNRLRLGVCKYVLVQEVVVQVVAELSVVELFGVKEFFGQHFLEGGVFFEHGILQVLNSGGLRACHVVSVLLEFELVGVQIPDVPECKLQRVLRADADDGLHQLLDELLDETGVLVVVFLAMVDLDPLQT